MKKTSILIALLCVSPNFVHAGDYEDAFLATEAGDYSAASGKWVNLANAGNPEAQFNLALMYHSGAGLSADEPEAVKWYVMAAEGGYRRAQEYLAAAYREGWFGLPRDTSRAEYWQKKLDAQN